CREEFDINRIKLLLLTFLIFILGSNIGAAAEVHPGGSIQAAVNNANTNGDTIIVYPGTYNENIEITRANNLVLMSASGNPDDTIIASNSINKSVISATSRMNLVIKGLTISGAANDTSGVRLESCRNCIIENNKFLNDAMGVYVRSSINTTVRNNAATRTSEAEKIGRGINIENSDSTIASYNTISNQRYGIYFSGSTRSTVTGNAVSQSADNGIVLQSGSTNSALENNTVSSSGNKGIYLKESGKSSVKDNIVSSNGGNGIDIELSDETTVLNNIISGNAKNTNIHGLFLNTCKGNTLQNNTISNCQYGVAIRYSENNKLINNNVYDNDRGFYVSYTSSGNTLSGNKANSNTNGIIVERGANNNVLENNEAILNSVSGIALDNATSNKISNNNASLNNRGIYLLSLSSKNTLSDNTVNSNKNDGIVLENSSENNLTSNIANLNVRYGIYMVSSNNSYMVRNTLQSNMRGISLLGSVKNMISNNTATDSTESGLFFSLCNNNTVSKNTVYNNKEGISFDSSGDNQISGNNISSNGNGIYMCPRSYPNRAYDNCFENINNANIRNNRSIWYTEKTSGKNVMGGPNIGGNFWGTPSLMGFSDTNADKDNDSDGIIDIPYVSDNGNITDNYPLIRMVLPVAKFDVNPTTGFVPLTVQFTDRSQDATSISWDLGDGSSDKTNESFTYVYTKPGNYIVTLTASNKNGTDDETVQIIAEEYKVKPVADFSANVTSGYAPLSVLLTDLSQNATSRIWDIGNDRTVESTDPSIVYVFTVPGTYPVNLTAINENGTSSKITSIAVTEKSISGGDDDDDGSSHSSGGSGGGGGGAGGSPEPQTNVQVKELSKAQVSNGKPVKFDFTKNATCVVYVSFDAKKTAGKITTIAEQLKAKSTLVSVLDSGEIYKYFNLWVGNSGFATEKNIEKPVICFKVEKSWMQNKKIEQSSITLNRYNDKKWSQIPVKLLNEDDKYLYFTAETPGFSFFAITGKAVEKEKVVETKPSTETSKLEKNTTSSETETEQKTEQETGKDKVTSIPGFEALYVVACLVMVFLHRRK
ncbi:MAG TPA: NosD domain-containing protein, partial [Methanosarcina sp.]|nr:NosD domain-containing protein [Methanosarcina sp.]